MTTLSMRRDSSANWTAANPVLADAEPGFAKDLNKFKIGDGVTAWNDLPFAAGDPGPKGAKGDVGNKGQTGDVGPVFYESLAAEIIAVNGGLYINANINQWYPRAMVPITIPLGTTEAELAVDELLLSLGGMFPVPAGDEASNMTMLFDNKQNHDVLISVTSGNALFNGGSSIVLPANKLVMVNAVRFNDKVLMDLTGEY